MIIIRKSFLLSDIIMTITPQEKARIESEIKNNFSELQKKLTELQSEITKEKNEAKKQEKQAEIDKMEKDLKDMKTLIDRLSSLQEQDLQSLKTRLEQYLQVKQDTQVETDNLLKEKIPTPTTYELLKDSGTYTRLLNIISSNSEEFKKLPWNTPEAKLEYMFSKIRESVVLFIKNKLGKSEKYDKIINNTIAPALEWSMIEMLRNQWNKENSSMLIWLDKISSGSFQDLVEWMSNFATSSSWSFNKFSQWVNAIDYLSVHNWVLHNPEKSQVLTNPTEFKNYLNDSVFSEANFSPYTPIDKNIFKIDENQTFEFWISLQEKQDILNQIWNIHVENNPQTISSITKILKKSGTFFSTSTWLQETANHLLDWVNAINPVAKVFGIDILWEISKAPEQRSYIYKIIDFICKFIWITWWIEWIVKRWRLDRMNLTDEKNEDISQIFEEYQKLAWKWNDIAITDENSCKTALSEFDLTDLDEEQSTTKWDYLRDVISNNMDLDLISPSVVQQILWDDYLKRETTNVNWREQEKITVDSSQITEAQKRKLAHEHIANMRKHLEENYDDLKDFYSDIHSIDDLVICITASLYANKEDIIEWIKAKVFLPENYGVVYESNPNEPWNWEEWDEDEWWWDNSWWLDNSWWWNSNWWWREKLDSSNSADKQIVSEQWLYDKAVEYWITDERQIAYVLSTVKWECSFKNQGEIWKWKWKKYWKIDQATWHAYYGRWFIQLTWKENYQKYTQIIKSSWKDFKDNNWNTLKWSEIDLVQNPDVILQSNDLAAFILMDWMKNWWPDRVETKKLSHYINGTKADYYHARSIVNWMSSQPQLYADNARTYVSTMWNLVA